MPMEGYLPTSEGLKKVTFDAITNTKFTIMHEIGHADGLLTEMQANSFALKQLGL